MAHCDATDVGGGEDCVIRENRIARAGRIYYSAIGIIASGCDILENSLSDLPYSGICASGGNTRVCGNKVYEAMKMLNDGAGIYVTFGDGGVMRGNYVAEIASTSHNCQRHGL